MERLTIEELIEHCDRQMNRLPSGNKFYQEHESVRAYLQMLRHYIATDLTPERVAELALADQDGRLVVLPEGTESTLIVKLVDAGNGDDEIIPSVETKGDTKNLYPMLSLAVSAVAYAKQTTYTSLLLAMMSQPPVGTLKPAEAEAAVERGGNPRETHPI